MTGEVDDVLAHYRSLVRRWENPLRTSGCAIWVRGRDHYRVGEVVHLRRATPSRTRLASIVRHNSAVGSDPLAGLVPALGGAVVLEPVGTDIALLADRLSLGGVAVTVRWDANSGVRVTSAVDGATAEEHVLGAADRTPPAEGPLLGALRAATTASARSGSPSGTGHDLAVGLTTAEALTGIRLPFPGPFTLLRAVRLRDPAG